MRLAWKVSETQFSPTRFVQSRLNRFYLSWARDSARLGSELDSVGLRIVVQFDSGLVSFLTSGNVDSNRLDLTQGSARFARGSDQLEARLGSLFRAQIASARGSGSAWGSARGSENQLNARLSWARSSTRAQLGAQLVTRDSAWPASGLSSAHLAQLGA